MSLQKQGDHLNKIKLFEAVHGPSEPIRGFMHRLQMLAYACNFTTKCSSKCCTETNYGANILLALVKGLAYVDIQAELLSEVEEMSLEDTIAFVSMRESEIIAATNARMPNQNVGFRNIPRGVERCTQAATTAQPSVSPPRRRCCPARCSLGR